MAIGDTAPLIPIRHDWSEPVDLGAVIPTTTLEHDDGSEQRLALSHLATERVTYRLIAPTNRDAASLLALVDLATDTWVRVPRWEDEARVSAAVASGTGVVIACDTTNKPTFAVGRQVMLWRGANEFEVTTASAVTSSSVTADLTLAWGAGTIVVPVMAGRVVLPLSRSHWVPTTGVLEFVVDFDLTDIAGVGTGGSATAGVVNAIAVGATKVGKYGRGAIVAVVTDAAGNRLPGVGIVWTSSDATNAPVYATSDPSVAMVGNPNGVLATKTITATIGAVSGNGSASLLA